MKSYLDLIPISAKVHRRQNRMIRLCIAISVFLIAVIFSMADMFLQSQKNLTIRREGAWHAVFMELSGEQTAFIGARPEVQSAARFVQTERMWERNLTVGGVKTALAGMDEAMLRLYPALFSLEAGTFPQAADEALVTESAADDLQLAIGDTVTLTGSERTLTLQVSGIVGDLASLSKAGAYGVFLNMDGYRACFAGEPSVQEDSYLFVQFKPQCRI